MSGKLKQLTMLTVVVTLAIAAAGWFLLIAPKNNQAKQTHTQAVAQQATNATLRNQLAILQGQEKNLVAQQAKLAAIATRIPDNPSLPSLIRGLSDAADKAGVDLMTLSPSTPAPVAVPAAAPVAPAAAAPGAAAVAPPAAVPTAALAEIPIAITISGSFFPVEQFLSNLEDLPRAFQITGMSAAPTSGAATPGTKVKTGQQLTVTLTGRVFLSPAGAAPAPVVKPTPAADPTK